jgi:pimeloyl-ACP methyl ester carboxylesterase
MSQQRIRYVLARDGVRVAWAEAGAGPVLVKASNWLTHLEYDWQSPIWRHWMGFLSGNFRFVRYDERGCGMTDREVRDVSFERSVEDLESVVEAAAPAVPFALLGISQGAAVCVAYAVRHPERVSRLVLYGREYEAIIELTVRNHASHVFDKLGVWTRAQAIVFARDRGFRPASGAPVRH